MPTLIAISVFVTMPGLRAELRCTFWTTFVPRLRATPEWSGQRIPTGPNVMQSGQIAAAALGARDTRLAIGVPVAPEQLGHPV